MLASSRPSRRAAASKKKPTSPVEGSSPGAVSEPETEVLPTPRKGGKKNATIPKAVVTDKSKATRSSARAKRTRSGEPKPDPHVILKESEGEDIKAPTRRGKKAFLGETTSPVLGGEEEDSVEKVEEQEGGELLQENADIEVDQNSKRETPRKREPTEEPVGQTQPKTTPPSRPSRQTTPVATISRTLPQGTPKPKSGTRAPKESDMVTPSSENKRTLAEAFPEGTGSTPERRRPASVAFPEGEDYTPLSSLVADTKMTGSPSRPMASGSPSRMKRSTTPQIIGPLSPRLTKHTPASTQAPQQVQQAPTPEKMKPRTVITHLIMTNFKSYAGRRVVGPFHPVSHRLLL